MLSCSGQNRFLFLFQDFHIVFVFQDVFQLHTPGGGGYGTLDATRMFLDKEKDIETVADPVGSLEIGNPSAGGNKTFVERGSVFEYRQAQESV